MAVEVRIPQIFRSLTGGAKVVKAEGKSVQDLFDDLDRQYPGLKERLMGDGQALHRFINVYLNDEDIRFLRSLKTEVKDGDILSILPAVAGGRIRSDD